MYELLNFSVDTPSTSVTQTHIRHQPQFKNTDYTEMTSFHDANISDQVNDSQRKQQQFAPMDNLDRPQFNPINHVKLDSHQDTNILNQEYQLNIPNDKLVDAVVNFVNNISNQNQQKNEQKNVNEIFLNHNVDLANQIENEAIAINDDDVVLDSFSSMSISSGPILDSQFAVEMCSDFIKYLDNNGGDTVFASDNNQIYLPNPNEQIMNFSANDQYIKRIKSDTLLATENIVTKSHLNYMSQCNTNIPFGTNPFNANNIVNFQLNPVRE